ncbi:hypothetical protein I6A62_02915 [Frankia sp. AgW1.1]|nr:hypothetical protein [Frankia sp. AgW1.1]
MTETLTETPLPGMPTAPPPYADGGPLLYVEHVTADRMCRLLVEGAQRWIDEGKGPTMSSLKDKDDPQTRLYFAAQSTVLYSFALVRILRSLPSLLADQMARDVWECWDDGGTVYELLWEYAEEYGQHEPKTAA